MTKPEQQPWHLGAKAAELYERYVARYILGPWAPLLVDLACLAEGERVLDVACGTGVVARVAAKRVGPAGRVVGVDLNGAMIGVARSLPNPTAAPIEWLERDALELGFDDGSFDVALVSRDYSFFQISRLHSRTCAACSGLVVASHSACGPMPGFTTVPSGRLSLNL